MEKRLRNMEDVGLARRYARALFHAVRDDKIFSSSQARKQIKQICGMIYSDRELEKTLLNPFLSFEKRKMILHQAMKKSSFDFHPLLCNFMNLLLKKKRLVLLSLVESDFELEIEKFEGALTAYVKSAVSLDEKSKKEMEKNLSRLFNRKVHVENEVQPDLLAGVVIQAGDTVMDNSLKSQLKNLKLRFERYDN